jgi:homoaconitase/3-isopropylmalate dehydratase large subunit
LKNETELLEDPMPMTISEKILAAHTSQDNVRPGELIEAKLSFVFGNDITAPMAIQVFKQAGGQHVFDPERVSMIPDHLQSLKFYFCAFCAFLRPYQI